jgi:glycosyltransferase involved in cell wall biosynthesis
MTHPDLLGRYRQADLFVLAPRIAEDGDRDGIPNVIAEAMAVGIPVVASDVSGIPELVRHGQTGWLAPSRDPAALAAAMRRILADAPLAERLARSARSVLEREFDLWQTTRGLHALMDCDACCAHDAAKPRAVQGSLPGAAAVAGEGAP